MDDREGKDGAVVAMEGNVEAKVQCTTEVYMVDVTIDEQYAKEVGQEVREIPNNFAASAAT